MPNIFDNISQQLLPTLRDSLAHSTHADFCIGYFNLRGWRQLADSIEHFEGGDGGCCRVLIGMHRSGLEEVRQVQRFDRENVRMDNGQVKRLARELAQEFREQLTIGAPSDADERALRQLAAQIRTHKVRVKLFLRHSLHAKLYLCFPKLTVLPGLGFVGSSNLTFSGLSGQGELNVDVKDDDACNKLSAWFNERWDDRWCIDVSDELVDIIETSWAREVPLTPYHIYLKIAYHLAYDARMGLSEFDLPRDLKDILFDYQAAAVKLAARLITERGGVVIGDVVGLGKTLMATALARILEEERGYETLVLCPKNLKPMWQDYFHRYGLRRCEVMSITRFKDLAQLRRYRLVIIDESHNLRNRKGKRYHAIRDYIARNDAHCILLTATPYNKTYLDLSNQLRLFISEEADLGIRPEMMLKKMGEMEFSARFQASPRSLRAFEHSEYPDDWRELMRLFLVRRTRSFVKQNYAFSDCPSCAARLLPADATCPGCGTARAEVSRRYLLLPNGERSYFPDRIPRTVAFSTQAPDDPYALLYSDEVVGIIDELKLPRYGLEGYVNPRPKQAATAEEQRILDGLSRAGRRLMGFCRTNLFKRLESSGEAFLYSVERHVLRNLLFVYAIEQGLPLPIGPQDAELLDTDFTDEDDDTWTLTAPDEVKEETTGFKVRDAGQLRHAAGRVYRFLQQHRAKRFRWLRPELMRPALKKHLLADVDELLRVLALGQTWSAERDVKVQQLRRLLLEQHPHQKVLLFSQFADTVRYLHTALGPAVPLMAAVTGATEDPTALAYRFSPVSNDKREQVKPNDELRVLLTTDVLSEGQNLQDAHIVVNYDLPWALIRLVQRAGRVDRIGQKAEQIYCYSFLPAEGVEKIIRLRERVKQRLLENAEVIGADEQFFDDDTPATALHDLYHEKPGALDGDDDREVDLASQALSVWQNALRRDPTGKLRKTIEELPGVVYSTKPLSADGNGPGFGPEGVLVYVRTPQGNDALAWLDRKGRSVTESPLAILRAAECTPDTPTRPRLPNHHELVAQGVVLVSREGHSSKGGQLGRPAGARFRIYERLKGYAEQNPIFTTDELRRVLEAIYNAPLTATATDVLNRRLRDKATDEELVEVVLNLHAEDHLVIKQDLSQTSDPHIICSLGLAN
jgi:superfamily II DNA or RNA helicase